MDLARLRPDRARSMTILEQDALLAVKQWRAWVDRCNLKPPFQIEISHVQ